MENSHKVREIIIGIIIIVIFAFLYIWTLNIYHNEGVERSSMITDNKPGNEDYMHIDIKLISIDPIKGDVSARIEFTPHGALASDDGLTLREDVNLYVNNASGKQEHNFAKGKMISPMDITLSLYEGMVSDYPFDKHDADLFMFMTTATQPNSYVLDNEINFFGSVHGFRIGASKDESSAATGYTEINMSIQRTASVVFFSVFVMILMWILVLSVIFLTLSVIVRKRKVELPMFAFISAMLFALPAMRNIQPFAPPIGCLSDYIAFFWCEAILGITLVTLVATWLHRPGVRQ